MVGKTGSKLTPGGGLRRFWLGQITIHATCPQDRARLKNANCANYARSANCIENAKIGRKYVTAKSN